MSQNTHGKKHTWQKSLPVQIHNKNLNIFSKYLILILNSYWVKVFLFIFSSIYSLIDNVYPEILRLC
jgi:hypothetical protein